MKKIDFRVSVFKNEITKYDGFVLYGAGYMTKEIIPVLKEIERKPLYIIVTDVKNNPEKIDEIPVYGLEQKMDEIQEKNILVVLAVTEKYEDEMKSLLQEKNIHNITMLLQYLRRLPDYLDKQIDWHLERIKDWYFDVNNKELDESVLLLNQEMNRNRVLFVVEGLMPRVIKIARALKKEGREVVLLLNGEMMTNPVFFKFRDSLRGEGFRTYNYNRIEELLFLLLENKSIAVHVFSNIWAGQYRDYILVQLQQYIGKIVFENYDIENGFSIEFTPEFLQRERYCLENAVGVCYREFSLEHLIDTLKFDIKGKTIRFFDYCSDDVITCGTDSSDKELSLCYVGDIYTEEDYPGSCYACFMEVARKCEKNRCHLHVYPPAWDEKRYKKFIDKDKISTYFHFHKPVAYDRLKEELSQYDYGIFPSIDDIYRKEVWVNYTKYKCIYAATNKFFDYLDAGLPIVARLPLKLAEFLEQKDVLINWQVEEYDFDYLMREKESMKKKVIEKREELKIGNHINELWEFYESL